MALSFPKNFLWGSACSAYQIEGAWNEGGKGESCHDHYARLPEYAHFYEQGRPDTCSEFYRHYREDIDIMAKYGLKSFRLSFAWPRLFPNGPDELNQTAVDYYNDMLNYLTEKGIVPFMDLFHWDLPQWVMAQGGATNYEFVEWFGKYARACFELFGDRVKYWSTVNEPNFSIFSGYYAVNGDGQGSFPPFDEDLTKAFTACHIMNLAHMRAVKIYREMGLDGKIGAVIDLFPFYPYDLTDEKDFYAADRRFDFYAGKWLGPMLLGKYPEVIIDTYSANMPANFEKEIADAYEPMDFIGDNYYAPSYAQYKPEKPYFQLCKDPEGGGNWNEFVGMKVYPEGLYDILHILNDKYHPKEIVITENGVAFRRDPEHPAVPTDIHDELRIKYMRSHIMSLNRAIESGINVTGYYTWAIEDTYEHGLGCNYDFGLIAINYDTMERIPRDSFKWYGEFIKSVTE